MKEIFAAEETEGLLLIDASNAFNVISRPATLWNCRVLWPRCSVFLFNSYRGFAVIIVKSFQADGRKGKRAPFLLLSREGTTQRCPLAMLQYAVGILPLITRLKDPSKHKQNWYADDSACAGSLVHIKDWLTLLLHHGPGFGYFAEPTKSVIVVKEPLLETARNLFSDLEVDVVTASRFLGGCVGNEEEIHQYVRSKVDLWTKHVERLAQAARAYPQSCYAAFTRSLSCEWAFLQRVVGDCDEEYVPLRDVVKTIFIPSVLGREVLEQEHELFELPVKNGGLAFSDPVKAAGPAFSLSKKATELLQEAVCTGVDADVAAHHTHCVSILSTAAAKRKADQASSSERLRANLPAPQQRTLNRIVKGSASAWLTVLPLQADGYDMSATQFRDQLAIRYHREPAGLPSTCDGCGAPFSLQHGLDCAKGGLVKRGHDDVRDNDARLADMAWGGVSVEPIMIPEIDRRGRSQLRADWMARGVWESGRVAFFDNRIVDADAPSYTNISWEAVANRAANAKKTKYNPAAEGLRGTFTPLVCSTDGVLHREYRAYQIRLASRLATKWQRPYSVVMKWVKLRMQFAVFRAVDLRLRGTRRRILGLGLQDGAAIFAHQH